MTPPDLSRRDFVLATGYAMAVMPVTALALSTPADDLEVADVSIPTGKEVMPAYVARPKKAGSYPVIMVVHEIFGVHEYIKDVCRRLAKEGYLAVAPYLYFRYGDVTKLKNIDEIRAQAVSKVALDQVMKDLDATMGWLKDQKAANSTRAGITGFCWGGIMTWMYAHHNPALKAGVAWYGRLDSERTQLQPKYPVDIAPTLKVPVLGLYGEKDSGIPLKDVDKMRAELGKGKSDSKLIVYKGAEHGFHADYRASYQEKAAKEGWAAMLKWFKEHGV